MLGHVAHIGNKNAYKVFVKKPERKRIFGKAWSRWEHSIKVNIRKIRLVGVNWIHVAKV